jgi:hypothetical protein
MAVDVILAHSMDVQTLIKMYQLFEQHQKTLWHFDKTLLPYYQKRGLYRAERASFFSLACKPEYLFSRYNGDVVNIMNSEILNIQSQRFNHFKQNCSQMF